MRSSRRGGVVVIAELMAAMAAVVTLRWLTAPPAVSTAEAAGE